MTIKSIIVDHYYNIHFSEVGQAKGYRVIEIDTNSKIQDTFKQLQPLKRVRSC